ncbi:FAST kinase domain-containing protein 1, mitochondrial-like [Haliotis cracherodii]|uniref:FAST kinase domain-containing protein 1, mitochondrial-like n=1 Tax=Haliotis cracherodii TaxID=6455 RepID=UPI0039EC3010
MNCLCRLHRSSDIKALIRMCGRYRLSQCHINITKELSPFGINTNRTANVSTLQKRQKVTANQASVFQKQHVFRETTSDAVTTDPNFEIERIFHYVQRELKAGRLTGKDFSSIIEAIQKARYRELYSVPWLYSHSPDVTLMQIVLNKEVKAFLGPVRDHMTMQEFLRELTLRSCEIPHEDCLSLLLHLKYLGMEKNEVVTKLLDRIQTRIGQMDIESLATLAAGLRSVNDVDEEILKKMMSRIQELLDEGFEKVDEQLVRNMCLFHISQTPWLSSQLSSRLLFSVVDMLQKLPNVSNSDILGDLLRYGKRLFLMHSMPKKTIFQLVDYVICQLPDHIDRLDSGDIASCCRCLKSVHRFDGAIASELQKRSMELFESSSATIEIRDIVQVCQSFTAHTPHRVKTRIYPLLLSKMDDADVYALSSLAEIFLYAEIDDKNVMMAFQKQSLLLFDNLATFKSRFLKVLRLLVRREAESETIRTELVEKLIQLQGDEVLFRRALMYSSTLIILSNLRDELPEKFVRNLQANISWLHPEQICSIMIRIKSQPFVKQNPNLVLQLHLSLQKQLSEKLETVREFDMINRVIQGLYLDSSTKDMTPLQVLMPHFGQVTKYLTSTQVSPLLDTLEQVLYYDPQVSENLEMYFLDYGWKISPSIASRILDWFVVVGYNPKNIEAFSGVCCEMMDTALRKNDVHVQVSLALNLCRYQIYPEVHLCQMFTLDYLHMFDKMREGAKKSLESSMMLLNRHLVLDCPHLDIPWFHEDFYVQYEKHYNRHPRRLESMVKGTVGGREYYNTKVYTPYHHCLDFEVLLDSSGQPVRHSSPEDGEDREYQRVAILWYGKDSYPLNSYTLGHDKTSKQRHLEILGYKVIPVPYYEWQSMGDNREYLTRKIQK